ncbi:cold shock and DUF1294 domain-containing protein [Nocardioides aestuarii]|uniref:DUF1294 domain-containing protein n=1 Tax=Nocardioides aestuarii TaxID=252231 RepID=A0ABW4TLG8_9ACTN
MATGEITSWNDDRGFGFITPTGGGPRTFVHITAFPGGGRPRVGLKVSYAESRDERGRPNASAVQYVGRAPRPRRRGVRPAVAVAAVFLLLVVGLALTGRVWTWLPLAYLVPSLISLLLYRTDKRAAETGQQRVMEMVLHLWDAVGGWPGALVARHLYRHKTTKQPFVTIFWLTVGVNCLVLAWLAAGMPTRLV